MALTSTGMTLADLLERFGAIPAARIRYDPPPGTATEQDVITLEARENRLFELVDGVLVEKAMGFYESFLAMRLVQFLLTFVEQHALGIVAGAAGMLRLAPGRVRIPDVSFISWDRLPQRRVPRQPIPDLVPDLAVEVLSEGNTPREMEQKLQSTLPPVCGWSGMSTPSARKSTCILPLTSTRSLLPTTPCTVERCCRGLLCSSVNCLRNRRKVPTTIRRCETGRAQALVFWHAASSISSSR